MIKLVFSQGNCFVYSVEAWSRLRQEHRILGELVGNTNFVPALPLKLYPEEVSLLIKRNLVEVEEFEDASQAEEAITKQESFKEQLLVAEIAKYQEIRRQQLGEVIDFIVEKRRNEGDLRSVEDILQEEMNKTPLVNQDNMIWPLVLQPLVPKTRVKNDLELASSKVKNAVFEDLYNKGYYVTKGTKFGGDFLAYFGDPIAFHAIFIVRCLEADSEVHGRDLVAFGRLGSSVKKKAVFASVVQDKVCYLTVNWMED